MKLTDGERLIAILLADLMEHLRVEGELDPELVKKLIFNKDEWALRWKYSGLFNSEQGPTEKVIEETAEILSMFRIIENSTERLEEHDRAEVRKMRSSEFGGFDANNDPHYGVSLTLIEDLGRFAEFKDRNLNSHSRSSLERYRHMKAIFDKEMGRTAGVSLSVDQLRAILS